MPTSNFHTATAGQPTHLISYLVLAVTLGLSLLAWHMAAKHHNAHQQGHFDAAVHMTESEIKQRMQHYADILESIRSLFYASNHVTPREFETFIQTSHIPQRYPGVQAIGYIQHLARRDAQRSSQDLRQVKLDSPCGYPDASIAQPGAQPEFHIVPFVEPMARNAKLLGEHMMMDPACRRALEQARDRSVLPGSV
jgi:CHASE1-domain containing sensor protein